MTTTSEVKKFYDEFSAYELKSGVNLRHYTIFNRVVQSGLRRHHHVLEIGCGIGQLTGLMHRYLRKGKLVSVDISPESIEIAKKRIPVSSRMEFLVSDMARFEYPEKFDFIILPDVLEHIPIENHDALFAILSAKMMDHTKIFIHIPHPQKIEYEKIHHPENLQIIDQSVSAASLLKACDQHKLLLDQYKAYTLFDRQCDYVFIVFKRDILPEFVSYSKARIIWKKSLARIRYLLNTIS